MNDRPMQLAPDMPLTVTLTAQQWLLVQQLLGEGPYRLVQPLIGEIQRQCMAQAERLDSGDGQGLIQQRVNGGIAREAADAR